MSRTGDLADHKRLGANRISKFRMVALRWIFARPLLVQQLHSENVRRPQISARAKEQYCSARDQGETICSGCYSSNSASIAGVRRLRGETQKLGNHCIRTAGGSAYGRPIQARSGPERDLARARTRVRSSFPCDTSRAPQCDGRFRCRTTPQTVLSDRAQAARQVCTQTHSNFYLIGSTGYRLIGYFPR